MTKRISFALLALLAMAGVAEAHPGHGTGLIAGLIHPFTGLDHLTAMIAVGLLGARLGGRAVWAVPLSFVAVMTLGGIAGLAGVSLSLTEAMVALSVVVLGALAIVRVQLPVTAAMAIAAVFAAFHGLAHGAELPAGASGLTFALGFIAATVTLLFAGVALGQFSLRHRQVRSA